METDYGNILVKQARTQASKQASKQASNSSLLNDSVKGQGGADLSPASHAGYRPDIDGLRAVAVLAVVFYHAFPSLLPGGFVGVDVFFVISGFLISGIILDGIASGNFSFLTFYARRIRRIFPTLFLVLVSVLFWGWFSLYPNEYQLLGKHVFGGSAFISNILFWQEVGYWDVSANVKPLLHLWSLGIEEQFYIIFPCLLALIWKKNLRVLTVVLVLLIVSFFLNIHYVKRDPTMDFYAPYTRFWELLVGAVLSVLVRSKYNLAAVRIKIENFLANILFEEPKNRSKSTLSDMLSVLGFIVLTATIFTNSSHNFPGSKAVYPVLGAVLLIAAGPSAWINRKLFSNKLLVGIGLISYPLYLWHWPLLSYAYIIDGGTSGTWSWLFVRIICVAFAIAFAILTYKYVERPIRFGQSAKTFKTVALLTAVFCVGTAGLFVYLKKGLPHRSFSPTRFLDRAAVRKKIQDRFSFVINSLPQLLQNFHRAFTGQEGWLFLGNDYDACLDKLTGKISPAIRAQSESSSAAIITQLKQYDGVKKIVFVGPNKSSIYPEFLPSDVRPFNQRYISPILQKFQESGLDVFDPTEILLNAKKEKLLYYRTDTHWNNFGAYLAVKGMLEHLGFTSEIIEASFKGLDFLNGSPHRGDLIDIGKFNIDAVAGDNFLPEWSPSHSDLTLIEHNGAQHPLSPTAAVGTPKFNEPIRVINPNATTKIKIWLVRDSFSGAASPFFHAVFAETLHINRGDNLSVLNYTPPDIIIYEGVERSF